MATPPKPKPKPDPDPPEPEEEADTGSPAVEEPKPARTPAGANNLSFGQKAVGLTFNPSGDPIVDELKREYAKIIDVCHMKRQSLMAGSEAHRLWCVAITTAQDAQMWGVKAATWRD